MAKNNSKIILKVAIDVILLILVVVPIVLYHTIGSPFKRGFFINDPLLQLPYKPSTVPAIFLFPCGIIIALLIIIITEFFNNRNSDYSMARSIYKFVMAYLFGCAASHLVVDICRFTTGRLRPHFVDICKPTLEGFFLQFRFCFGKYRMIRFVLQLILFIAAIYVVQSRVTDYQHHLSDVIAGCLVGFVFAVFCIFWVAKIITMEIPCRFSDELRLRYLRRHIGHPHEEEEKPPPSFSD